MISKEEITEISETLGISYKECENEILKLEKQEKERIKLIKECVKLAKEILKYESIKNWFNKQNPSLGNKAPIGLLKKDVKEIYKVIDLLGRIQHGIPN